MLAPSIGRRGSARNEWPSRCGSSEKKERRQRSSETKRGRFAEKWNEFRLVQLEMFLECFLPICPIRLDIIQEQIDLALPQKNAGEEKREDETLVGAGRRFLFFDADFVSPSDRTAHEVYRHWIEEFLLPCLHFGLSKRYTMMQSFVVSCWPSVWQPMAATFSVPLWQVSTIWGLPHANQLFYVQWRPTEPSISHDQDIEIAVFAREIQVNLVRTFYPSSPPRCILDYTFRKKADLKPHNCKVTHFVDKPWCHLLRSRVWNISNE